MRGRGDAGLAAVAAATAVQAGHVHAVQVLVVLPAAVAQGVVLLDVVVLLAPGGEKNNRNKIEVSRAVTTRRHQEEPFATGNG